jgi:hypothetical protein
LKTEKIFFERGTFPDRKCLGEQRKSSWTEEQVQSENVLKTEKVPRYSQKMSSLKEELFRTENVLRTEKIFWTGALPDRKFLEDRGSLLDCGSLPD